MASNRDTIMHSIKHGQYEIVGYIEIKTMLSLSFSLSLSLCLSVLIALNSKRLEL